MAASVGLFLGLVAPGKSAEMTSGLKVGEDVPTFDVVDLTGPNRKKPSLCYT